MDRVFVVRSEGLDVRDKRGSCLKVHITDSIMEKSYI